jgi:DHA1 family bicyclomycin/chloramphenicol resistance-like MFS transporter
LERGLRLFLILGALSALGPATMDNLPPRAPDAHARELGTTESTAQLTVSLYLVGLGVGQLIAGPLSDRPRRRAPLMASLALYLVATRGCAFAPSIAVLVAARLLQGTTAAAGVAIGRAIVRDLFAGRSAARYLSRLVLIYGLAPMIAPLVGSQILRLTSWRGVFAGARDRRRCPALRHRRRASRDAPASAGGPASVRATAISLGGLMHHRPLRRLRADARLRDRRGRRICLGSPFVVQDHFGKSAQIFGLLFAVNASAMVVGSQINAHLLGRDRAAPAAGRRDRRDDRARRSRSSSSRSRTSACCRSPRASCALMGTWGFIPANAIALAGADHPDVAGSASALLGLAQYGIAAIAAPIVGVGGASPTPLAVVILVLAVLCAVSALGIARPVRRPPVAVLRR